MHLPLYFFIEHVSSAHQLSKVRIGKRQSRVSPRQDLFLCKEDLCVGAAVSWVGRGGWSRAEHASSWHARLLPTQQIPEHVEGGEKTTTTKQRAMLDEGRDAGDQEAPMKSSEQRWRWFSPCHGARAVSCQTDIEVDHIARQRYAGSNE